MAELFQFELVSPERQLLSEQVAEVVVPGAEGEFGVLKNHAPFISTILPGILKVRSSESGGWDEYFVRGGFADVAAGGLTVLAEQAVPVGEISREQLDQAIQDAQEDVSDAKDDASRQKAEMTLAQLKDVAEALTKA
ncbi:F0F1 ATP synthase subunit epsilon [Roseibium aggregatum]|uniref:F0F1 ATP synthase subunit epsilon n=1 Tax=Roseibium aggregatum TaxID=187304 RepID=UPI001E46FF27|nr:F0F1 ATP synthase subunit epsilon [Roseibium aggregatum]UES37605.1 F0F1 ATP synthase subunit epsilon [Roseibium aggregatum]